MRKIVKNIVNGIMISPIVAVIGWLLWSFLSGGGLVIGLIVIITGVMSLFRKEE